MHSYELKTSDRGIASVILNRPGQHNAFDDGMIVELIELLDKLEQDDRVRVLVLRAAGKSFSAGADLNWMRRMADYDSAQNQDDAMQLAELMRRLNCFPKPTIALVQGAAYGGGVGLVAWAGFRVLQVLDGIYLASLPSVSARVAQSVIPIGAVLFIIAELMSFAEIWPALRRATGKRLE